jgi:hypothetical protein
MFDRMNFRAFCLAVAVAISPAALAEEGDCDNIFEFNQNISAILSAIESAEDIADLPDDDFEALTGLLDVAERQNRQGLKEALNAAFAGMERRDLSAVSDAMNLVAEEVEAFDEQRCGEDYSG